MKNLATGALALAIMAAANPAKADNWHLTFETNYLGPVELVAAIERDGTRADFVAPRLELEFTCEEDACTAQTRGGNTVVLNFDGDEVSGSVDNGLLSGGITGGRTDHAPSDALRDYPALAEQIIEMLHEHVFDPSRLETPAFASFVVSFREGAATAANDFQFIMLMHSSWEADEPFSHVQLRRSNQSVDEMATFFDSMRLGYDVARLEWQGDIAVLTVDSMMGNDTIEQIETAYDEIAARGADALIIDLRENGGGAFAIKPLVEHIIDEPTDVGYFLSRRWTEENESDPSPADVAAVTPWEGWSILAFWSDVLEQGILRLRFFPDENNYDGPVYILVSDDTASASEIAVDALQASGAATIVGTTTDGAVLSQTMFDLDEGFQLSLPIADYVSAASGRLEGQGITPDIEVPANEAMDHVLELLSDD